MYYDIPFICGPSSVKADGPEAEKILAVLAGIIGLTGPFDAPNYPVIVTLADSCDEAVLYTEREVVDFHRMGGDCATITINPDAKRNRPFFYSVCGRVILTSVLALNPAERIAFHGALLEQDGRGIALLAGSGTGKSTTLARHNSQGGCGVADDWLLINRTSEGFVAQVLPTWSRISAGLDCRFPIGHSVPLDGIGLLARAGDKPARIKELDAIEFYPHVFNASEILTGLVLQHLPVENTSGTRANHIAMIDRILEVFRPFVYFASLDDRPGDLLFARGSSRTVLGVEG